MRNVPCMNCGSTEWTVSMVTDCDKCNPDLSIKRLQKQMECHHKNTKPSNIIDMSKCLDCGLVGVELFSRGPDEE